MTLFAPACPEQGYFKCAIYGPPGSGKTCTALLWAEGLANREGKKVAFVDTERGTDFYAKAVPERLFHPEPFKFDAVYTRSLSKTTEATAEAVSSGEYAVIVLDSITHLWEAAIAAYEGKRTKIDSIPMPAWGSIKRPYKALMKVLVDSPIHVLILGRQKNVFVEDEDEKIRKVGVDMRAEGETPYEPHICVRMEGRRDPRDSTKTTYLAYFEKDRTSVLAGRTVANPDFGTISGILSLLGKTQASSEDLDEVAAADSELLSKHTEKSKAKEEKSKVYLAEFTGKITQANDPASLSAVHEEIRKAKRYILEEDMGAIGVIYTARRDKIAQAAMPAEVG